MPRWRRDRVLALLAVLATLALLGPIGWLWFHSLTGSTYSVMSMGYADYGGGARPHGAGMSMSGSSAGHAVSVRSLVPDPHRKADVTVDLVARQGKVRLASGRTVDGFTVNGSSPGPQIDATQGQLVEVHLRNANIREGITLHWHGVDVPNAEDGVAGVTQDAVEVGQTYTYRFVADHAGTYWYHSHQVSHDQVVRGLLGPLVVHPRHPDAAVTDITALAHLYAGRETIDGDDRTHRVTVPVGSRVRVRVINTDNGPTHVWTGAAYRVLAVDGRDVHQPSTVTGKGYLLTAGGRVDLGLTVPTGGARVQVGSSAALVLGPAGTSVPSPKHPRSDVDLLHYGTPAPLGFEPATADRHFHYDLGRRPGFVHGKPGMWWSVNGHLYPHMPMFVVERGDVVQVRIHNGSGDVHPLHLHGHHAVVLSRNGVKATGSPWWFDSLNVADGDSYVIAFVADNPGIWMDHCHNLTHAQQGLVTHLMYAGVTTPYRVGGKADNAPE